MKIPKTGSEYETYSSNKYPSNFETGGEDTLNQIEHFFAHYKDLEPDKWVKIKEMGDAAMARALIGDAIVRARDAAKRKP